MNLSLTGKNEKSHACECVIFGRLEPESGRLVRMRPDVLEGGAGRRRELILSGTWKLRDMSPGESLAPVPALFSWTAGTGTACEASGQLVLLSHPWSGMVRVLERGREYLFDLYSERTRLLALDLTSEIVVDITSLASTEEGVLHLPPLPKRRIVEHIVESRSWFSFLNPQAAGSSGWLRRVRDLTQDRSRERARLEMIAMLLPALVSQGPGPQPSPGGARAAVESGEYRAFRDELRLVCAAVDGVVQRISASA